MSDERSRAERIRHLVETTTMTEADATFAVDFSDGKTTGDIVGENGPLSEDERRRLGLGGSIFDPEYDDLDRDDPSPA
jgi:hypothetical protein